MGWRWAALCAALCCSITAAAADYDASNYQKNMSSSARANLRNVRTSLHSHAASPAPMPNPDPLSEGPPVDVPRLVEDSLRWHNISKPANATCKVGPQACNACSCRRIKACTCEMLLGSTCCRYHSSSEASESCPDLA